MYIDNSYIIDMLADVLPGKNSKYAAYYLAKNAGDTVTRDLLKILTTNTKLEILESNEFVLISYKELGLHDNINTLRNLGLVIDNKVICITKNAEGWKNDLLVYSTNIRVAVLWNEHFDFIKDTYTVNRFDCQKISSDEIVKHVKNFKKSIDDIEERVRDIIARQNNSTK